MHEILLIFLISALGALTPGPAFVYVISYSLQAGFLRSLYITLGVATATFFLCGVTMLGLSQVMMTHARALILFKIVSGLWLMWLGFKAFRARHHLTFQTPEKNNRFNPKRYFWGGFLLQATNPKAAMYWMASMSLVIIDKPSPSVLGLGMLTAMLSSFIVYSMIALVFSGKKIKRFWNKMHQKIMTFFGILYTFFGLKIISEI